MNKIKTAVIGVGSLGQHHARILSQHENSDLIGVVDASEERGKQIANACKTANFTNIKDIIGKVNAVVIAVPTPYHYDVAKQFLNAGVHCLIEKPITLKVEHADELIQIAKDKKLVLQVGHIERFNPAFTSAKPYIKEPKFIEAVRIGTYDPRMSHIGVVLDLMIHDLDVILTIVKSKVISIEAYGEKVFSKYEDRAKARLRFENGCVADISISRVSFDKCRKMMIFQNNGFISLDYGTKTVNVHSKKSDVKELKTMTDIETIIPEVKTKEPLFYELDHFLSCIKDNKTPMITGENGRDALKLAHEILKNIKY
jgi:predicted dehydrogenase